MRTNLYVKNWPVELNEEQLTNVFCKFGKVESVKILTQECLTIVSRFPVSETKPTGKAFISFSDEKSAELALHNMKNILINNQLLKLYRWVPKNVLYNKKPYKTMNTETYQPKIDPVKYFNFEKYKNSQAEDRKRVFGEAIYQEIFKKYDKWTGKLTGMIIDLEESELLQMMQNKQLLYKRTQEAMSILAQANNN